MQKTIHEDQRKKIKENLTQVGKKGNTQVKKEDQRNSKQANN